MDATRWTEPPTAGGAQVGIYGWQKRCLYAVILLLLCVVTLNIALVYWIMNVLQLNSNGMSYMHMIGSGVQLTRKTYIEDVLVAAGVVSGQEPLTIQSTSNVTLMTTDHAGFVASNVFLGNDVLEVNTSTFRVTNPLGKTLFSVDKDTVSVAAHSLSILGEGGASVEGTVQTPLVSAGIGSDLVLESVTKAVQAITPGGVSIESRAGDIQVSSNQDINLITIEGSIKLESGYVLMPTLRHPPPTHHHLRKHHHQHAAAADRIYQLCVCSNGELYLGEAESSCESSFSSEVCR